MRTAAQVVATEEHRAAARCAAGVDAALPHQADAFAIDLDRAAALARLRAADVDLAADQHPALRTTVDHDLADHGADGLGLHDAIHVQHRVRNARARRGAQVHHAAVGLQPAQHLQPGLQPLVVARVEEHEAVAVHVDLHLVGRRGRDALGVDDAVQADLRPGEGDRAG